MPYEYDDQNIFAKILRGEIPSCRVLETEHTVVFHDIHPQAPTHLLAIPKGPYVNFDHFAAEASDAEIADFVRATAQVAREAGHAPGEGGDGYRVLSNAGPDAHQEVPHLHFHVFGGAFLGRMIRVPDQG